MGAAAVIPARFASTRLPGKPLLDRTGLPLVIHVAKRASEAKLIERVIIATDDERILEVAGKHGFEAVMTRGDHPNGTCRIEEAAGVLGADIDVVVNVQGDEPLIDPDVIDAVTARLQNGDEPMATVAAKFGEGEDAGDPNIVKVVVTTGGRAMYFSRAQIPFDRDGDGGGRGYLKHVGLYAYRRDFLGVYVGLTETGAECAEKLEQLRVLEHGYAIGVVEAAVSHHGIDTPEQYEAFVKYWEETRPRS